VRAELGLAEAEAEAEEEQQEGQRACIGRHRQVRSSKKGRSIKTKEAMLSGWNFR
jgi:hypothetical protein